MAWPLGLLPSCSCSQGDACSPEPECWEPNPPALCQPLVWSCPEEEAQTTGSEKIRKGTWKGLADLDQHERKSPRPRNKSWLSCAHCYCPVPWPEEETHQVLLPSAVPPPQANSPLPEPPGAERCKAQGRVSSPLEGTSLTSLSLFPHLQSEGNETSFL